MQSHQNLERRNVLVLGSEKSEVSSFVECLGSNKPVEYCSDPNYNSLTSGSFILNDIKWHIDGVREDRCSYHRGQGHIGCYNAAIIIYDITDPNFNREKIMKLVDLAKTCFSYSEKNNPILLIGTKCDYMPLRRVPSEEGLALSQNIPNCIGFQEVSSKENLNVFEAFQQLANFICNRERSEKINEKNSNPSVNLDAQLTDRQKQYLGNLEQIWNQTEKTDGNLKQVKAVLDYYTNNNNFILNLFSASNHIPDVQIISNHILTSNPTGKSIIDSLEILNYVKTGDVAAIIHFLRLKFQYFSKEHRDETKFSM